MDGTDGSPDANKGSFWTVQAQKQDGCGHFPACDVIIPGPHNYPEYG
jgi:hypothetical protein